MWLAGLALIIIGGFGLWMTRDRTWRYNPDCLCSRCLQQFYREFFSHHRDVWDK